MKAQDIIIYVRGIAVMLALGLGLTGCSGNVDDGDRVEITWTIFPGDATRPVFLSTINEFEKQYPHIKVQPLEITGNYYQKVTVMMAGRTPPDVLWMGQGFGEFAARGAFLDLSDRIAAEIDSRNYHPKVMSWYRVNDKQFGIPYGVDMRFIVYNKKAFDEAGLPYPKDGWTLDDFVATAKKLTIDRDGDGRIDQYGFRGELSEAIWGAQFVADDGSEAMCDRPEMIDWANFHLDMLYRWKVAPTPEQIRAGGVSSEYSDQFLVFRQGKVAMLPLYTFSIRQLREKCPDVDWDIITNPVLDKPAHWASSQAFLVAADTKHPEEAWLLFKHLLGERFQLAMSADTFPANRRLAQKIVTENTLKPMNLGCLLGASDTLSPYPRIPNLGELVALWNNTKEKVFSAYGTSRSVSPEEAFTEAARRINDIITRRRRG